MLRGNFPPWTIAEIVMRTDPTEQVGESGEPVALSILGCFDMVRGGARPALPHPAQRLMALLSVGGGIERSHAAEVLWPEVEHSHALANLRTALWRLRGISPVIVRSSGSDLRLDPAITIDMRQAEELAHRILYVALPLHEAREASSQLSHDLLPDWDEEWLEFERERFRDLRIHALERLCIQLSALGEHADAVQCGLLAVQGERLRESSHRALMQAHIAEGNRARALQVFQLLERILDRELQVRPSQATIDLANELCRRGTIAQPTVSASG
jgi:DNA-binding SARP family transcriptional activator